MKLRFLSLISLLPLSAALIISGCASGSGSSMTTSNPGTGATGSTGGTGSGGSGSGGSGSGGSTTGAAFVYVSTTLNGSESSVAGFAAASDGSLKPLTGSPFAISVGQMAVNGKFLFGEQNSQNLISASIASDGALTQVATVNAQAKNKIPTDGGPISLFLDKSGQTLYDGDIYADGSNNAYQSWAVQTNGSLQYVATTPTTSLVGQPLTFTKDDHYAYGASCIKFNPAIFGYSRNSDGSLTPLQLNPQFPTPNGSGGYCPYLAGATNDFHLVVTLTPNNFAPAGPTQLGVYSINSDGTLTTTSTAANMPTVSLTTINDLKLDPMSAFVAVSGQNGLLLFQTHGSSPLTPLGASLTTANINEMFWDNAGHLYAVSRASNSLYVFTVTTAGATAAPGSPYSVSNANYLAVQPLS